MRSIDVDDRRTWPSSVKTAVKAVATRLRGSTEYISDLPIDLAEEDAFRTNLRPQLVRAYHATRLLDHEVDKIRTQGLRELTVDLISERVDAAFHHGAIDLGLRDRLRTATVFHDRDAEHREGATCLFMSRRILDEDVPGVWPLLTTWGGEGIYMSSDGAKLRPILKTLGKPSVVVINVDLSEGRRTHLVWPGILHCFLGKELGLHGQGAEVHYRGSIPAPQVVDIWQPGHPSYDRHPELRAA